MGVERLVREPSESLGLLLLLGLQMSRLASTARPSTPNHNELSLSDHLDLVRQSRRVFANKTLVVSIVDREPFVIFDQPLGFDRWPARQKHEARKRLENFSGIAIEIVRRLKSIFGFSIELTSPADGKFGAYLPENGTWTGLMGQLARAEVDLGVTALSLTMSRGNDQVTSGILSQYVDFSRAYYVDTATFLTRTPEEIQNYKAIFEPFSASVWVLLLLTILVLIGLISIMTKLEDDQRRQVRLGQFVKSLNSPVSLAGESARDRPTELDARRLSAELDRKLYELDHERGAHEFGESWRDRFYYAVTCVLNILLIRDIKNPPHQTPIRILVCFWWLSTIVIVNIYLGILFGQLVIPRRPESIDTLEELASQEQVSWAVTSNSALYELFRQSEPNSIYGQLGRRMQLVSTADEGVGRVLDSNWAFIRERSILIFKIAQEHSRLKACRLQLAREQFYSVGFGLGLVKNSNYTEPFNSALTLMIENGLISHFQSMYWPKKNEFTECSLKATEGSPLTIKHFISIYLVCAVIVCASVMILVHQHIHHKNKENEI